MSTEEAIEVLNNEKSSFLGERIFTEIERTEAFELAIAALRDQQEAEKNEPLTEAQLREMSIHEWVWIECLVEFDYYGKSSAYYARQEWGTAEGAMKETFFCGYPGRTFGFEYCNYGKTWLAYRYKPKEGTK